MHHEFNISELLGQAKNMLRIKCHKFRELNTELPNIRAEHSVRTSIDKTLQLAQFDADQKRLET